MISVCSRKTTNSRSSLPKVNLTCFRTRAGNDATTFPFLTDWAGTKEDEEELSVWEDNWDDDNVEDDFNQQLRAQLEKQKPSN